MKFRDLNTRPKIFIAICSPVLLMLVLGGAAIHSIGSIVKTEEAVDHTHAVLGKAAAIVRSAVDMETGMHGYLLAGKEEFLAPYNAGEKRTYMGIAALRRAVEDNPPTGRAAG